MTDVTRYLTRQLVPVEPQELNVVPSEARIKADEVVLASDHDATVTALWEQLAGRIREVGEQNITLRDLYAKLAASKQQSEAEREQLAARNENQAALMQQYRVERDRLRVQVRKA